MSYFELLENRASCRKYTDEMPADELVEQVLLAGNMAPIGSNRTEDVHLTVVRDRAVLDGLAQAMNRRMKDRADLNDLGLVREGAAIDALDGTHFKIDDNI